MMQLRAEVSCIFENLDMKSWNLLVESAHMTMKVQRV